MLARSAVFCLSIALYCAPSIFAEEQLLGGKIVFDRTTHNYGKLSSPSSQVHTCTFTFSNLSEKDVRIRTVNSTCRCYDVNWTKDYVKPGDTGTIVVSLDNNGLEGEFDKKIFVYFTICSQPVTLHLKGSSAIPSLLEQKYQYRFGPLGVEELTHNIGPVQIGEVIKTSLRLANLSNKSILVTFQNLSPGLELKPAELSIPAKTEKEIIVSLRINNSLGTNLAYCRPFINNMGYIASNPFNQNYSTTSNYLMAEPNCKAGVGMGYIGFKSFNTPALIEGDNAPIISIESKEVGFGHIHKNESASITYKITNTGNSNLILYKCEHHRAVQVDFPEFVSPGKTGKIKCHLSGQLCPIGDVTLVITLLSNAPASSIISLSMSGSIEP